MDFFPTIKVALMFYKVATVPLQKIVSMTVHLQALSEIGYKSFSSISKEEHVSQGKN